MVYERQIATARRLIQAKGQLCLWREPGETTGPANAPIVGIPAEYTVPIVFLSNSNRASLAAFRSMFPDMPDVPTSGLRGLMAVPLDFTPSLLARVSRGLGPFAEPGLAIDQHNGLEKLDINGEPILYYLRFGE